MQNQDIPGDHDLSPAEEDRKIQNAVLDFILSEHPAHLSEAELVLAFHRDAASFPDTDAIARAIAELVGAGLLRRFGTAVVPTRAALYFSRLEVD